MMVLDVALDPGRVGGRPGRAADAGRGALPLTAQAARRHLPLR